MIDPKESEGLKIFDFNKKKLEKLEIQMILLYLLRLIMIINYARIIF